MSDEKARHGNRGELLGNGKIDGKKFRLEDISSSGCRIRYMGELVAGETYDVILEVYGHPGMKRHVEMVGRVVRAISRSELVGNEFALEFVGLSEHAKIDLDELINLSNSRMLDPGGHHHGKEHVQH